MNSSPTKIVKRDEGSFKATARRLTSISKAPPGRRAKIFITRPDVPESAIKLLKNYSLDIWEEEEPVPRDVFLKRIAGKDALFICSSNVIDQEALNAAGGNLKVIGTMSSGLDHIDVEEVKKRGIKLGYTGGVLKDAVAEFAVGLLLACSRRFFEGHKQIVQKKWQPWTRWDWLNGRGLKGAVVGIFGLGRIGLEIAKRLVPFKPSRILYVSRREKETKAERVSLSELFQLSDIIAVCVSLNKETEGIIDEEKLSMMKPTAILVNISRGAVINQNDLVRALKNQKIGGAALDVMTPEPLPADHVLLTLDNCVITPHIGSAEVNTRIEMAEIVSKNIVAGLTDTPLPMEV